MSITIVEQFIHDKKSLTDKGISSRAIGVKITADKKISKLFEEFAYSHVIRHEQRIGRRVKQLYLNPIYKKDNYYIMPYYLHSSIFKFATQYKIKIKFIKKEKSFTEYDYDFYTDIWPSKLALIDEVFNEIIDNGGATLLLNTGEGKTVILSKLIQMIGSSKVMIFTVNKELQKQMHNDIKKHLGDIDIMYIGGHATKEDKTRLEEDNFPPITIAISKSATAMTEGNPTVWDKFDFAIFDECHRYCAPGTKKIMVNCSTKYKLALSATVDHTWNWPLIVYSCGNLINGNEVLDESGHKRVNIPGRVEIIKYHGPAEYTRKLTNKFGDTQVCKMVEQFAEDPWRCQLIINEISKLVDTHTIMVITFSNCMIEKLREMTEAALPGIILGTVNQLTSDEDKEHAKENAQIIFTTYMSGSMGLNIPRITAMVFASSFVKNGIQITGRALRKDYMPDKERVFIDIVDYEAANYSHQMPKRIKVWKERGFKIDKKDINWNEIKI